MNKELLKKILSGAATATEEHQLAELLRQQHGAPWPQKDLTDEYDRLVAARQTVARPARRVWLRRVAVAAVVVGAVVLVSQLLRPSAEPALPTVAEAVSRSVQPEASGEAALPMVDTVAVAELPKAKPVHPRRRKKPQTEQPAVTTVDAVAPPSATDSLAYYLARLEHCLDQVDDSVYMERAEEIIRADARLQLLVNRIYQNQFRQETENNEALYLKY